MTVPDRVVRIELISYFSLCPETVATSEEMAERLGRGLEQVRGQMRDLVELGILEQTGGGDRVTYRYLAPICANLSNRKVERENLPGMPAGRGAGASGPDESGGREADGEEKGEENLSCG